MKLKRITPVPLTKKESDKLNKYVDVLVERHRVNDPNDMFSINAMLIMEVMCVMGAIYDMTKHPKQPHKKVKYELQMFDDWSMLSEFSERSRFDDADYKILEEVLSFYPQILGFEKGTTWADVHKNALDDDFDNIMGEFIGKPVKAGWESQVAKKIATFHGF